MIPLDIDNPAVLRRTLEEIEDSIPIAEVPLTQLLPLTLDADLATAVLKINELVTRYNSIATVISGEQ